MRFRTSPRTRRGANLTPMVDVVFLLLFFFMLASRFGADAALPLSLAGGAAEWQGPPRLVEIGPRGELLLNGFATAASELPGALDDLTGSRADAVVIAPKQGATVGDLAFVLDLLGGEGFSTLAVTE